MTTNKTLVGIHWLSLVIMFAILIMASISLYRAGEAKNAIDPTDDINIIYNTNIALIIFIVIIIIPMLMWCYKQSKVGFGSTMVNVVM